MIGALAQRCVRLGAAPCILAAPVPALRPRRVYRPYRCSTVLACAAQSPRRLSIIHFNDVYDIAERKIEPVGGAARFTAAVQSFAAEDPLVVFSGDCLNPSLLSAFTKGEQMVPILNAIGVKAACLGNRELSSSFSLLRCRHLTKPLFSFFFRRF
jgi:5'-nucleotidase